MAVKFKDYYETLGVGRDATQADVQRAYRQKARKAHPDVDKSPGAEERFKELNEAYEVLRDPEKRKRYDQLGANWQGGQDFQPPPGWENAQFDFGEGASDLGGFSDFFSALFGGGRMGGGPFGGRTSHRTMARRGRDHEAELELTLEELAAGGSKSVQLSQQTVDASGRPSTETRTFDVKLPAGLVDGSRIRLAGQGGTGTGGGPAGDLFLVVRLRPHPRFAVEDHDLRTAVQVTPWEAVLGGAVTVQTLTGEVNLKIAPGTQSGQVLRLRGQGLPKGGSERGDLLAVVRVVVPDAPTADEKALFEKLAETSQFRPSPRSRKP